MGNKNSNDKKIRNGTTPRPPYKKPTPQEQPKPVEKTKPEISKKSPG